MGEKKKGGSKPSLPAVLDDLMARFIINAPEEELSSFDRILFLVEQAHWFYEDFYREKDRNLPSMNLKDFTRKLFGHCPLLQPHLPRLDEHFTAWKTYKLQVPVCGCILVNANLDKCLLVKGWNSRSSWGFPKGKINKDEPQSDCAVREVFEETGFDAAEMVDENEYLEVTIKNQTTRLYIVPYVDERTPFAPRTRKEISKIEWHPVNSLPTYRNPGGGSTPGGNNNKYFTVIPFVNKLKAWLKVKKKSPQHKKLRKAVLASAAPPRALKPGEGFSYANVVSGQTEKKVEKKKAKAPMGHVGNVQPMHSVGPPPMRPGAMSMHGVVGQMPPMPFRQPQGMPMGHPAAPPSAFRLPQPPAGNRPMPLPMPMPMPMHGSMPMPRPMPMPMQIHLPAPMHAARPMVPPVGLPMPPPRPAHLATGHPWLDFRLDMEHVMRAIG